MTDLLTVVTEANALLADLLRMALRPDASEKRSTALRADALIVLAATQALALRPAHGYRAAPDYDAPLKEIGEARKAVDAADFGDPASLYEAHVQTVQAAEAMRAVTG